MLALYRRMLHLYPAGFRTRFADEMEQLVRDEITHGDASWFRVFGDLAGSALVQRWKERSTMKGKLPIIGFLVIGVIGVTALTTGSAFEVSSLLVALGGLAFAGVLFAIASLIGRRGSEHVYATRRFRWWWVPAGLLGAFQLVFMAGQLIEDPKWENVVALVVVGAFSGLVFGGMAIGNRRAGNWMIATGVLPMVPFFWVVFPPVLALITIVGALSDNVRMTARAAAAV